jgi:hypothetical protein
VFENLHHHRRIAHLRLRDEEMKMLRHDHVSVHDEAILAACLFQNLEEKVTASGRVQARLSTITTASNKMKVVGAVEAVEPFGHGPD